MAHWFSPCRSVRVAKLQALIMSVLRFKICFFAAWYVSFCILKGILLPSERYPFAFWKVPFCSVICAFLPYEMYPFVCWKMVFRQHAGVFFIFLGCCFLLTVHIRSYCLFHVFLYVRHINPLPLTPFPDFGRYVFCLFLSEVNFW